VNAINGLSKEKSLTAELKRQGWDAIDLINDILQQPMNQQDSAEDEELAELPQPEAERQTITNYTLEKIDGKEEQTAKPIDRIVDDIFRATKGWPKMVGGRLFAEEGSRTHKLTKNESFFAWLQSKATLDWRNLPGVVTKKECFERICQRAETFQAVTDRPHREPFAGVFYTGEARGIEAKATGLLDELAGKFFPYSELDRELIKAAFVTPCWDGPPGKRPLIVITADGRGFGKTTLVKFVCDLWGEPFKVSPNAAMEKVVTRLLSKLPQLVRVGWIDNVKKTRFSWEELEDLTTAPTINGHDLYVGDGSLPNLLTWFLTLNNPSFDEDLAMRSATIKVQRPDYDASWEGTVKRFIDENRIGILQDCLAFFQKPPASIQCGRFPEWDREVIGRLREPGRLIKLLAERCKEINESSRDAEAIIEAAKRVISDGRDSCFIKGAELVKQLNEDSGGDDWNFKNLKAAIDKLNKDNRENFPLQFKELNSGNGYLWVENIPF
jgi:hypothetical protein